MNMKSIVPYLITALVAVIAVKVVYPKIQPTLAALPVLGSFFPA